MAKVIAFNASLFAKQREENIKYMDAINTVLCLLSELLPDLSVSQVSTFLAAPQNLCEELRQAALQEFNTYCASLPKSVRNSMSFTFTQDEAIMALHAKLPQPQSYYLRINTCQLSDNGKCQFDEERLRDLCSVHGDEALASIWEKAQSVAQSLTDLQKSIQSINKDFYALEQPRLFEIGLICKSNGTFKADVERLTRLEKGKLI